LTYKHKDDIKAKTYYIKSLKTTLFTHHGKTTYHHIDIEVDSAGNIIISGISMGEDSKHFSDNSFSEFSVSVASRFRDKVITALQTEFHKKAPSELISFDDRDREMLWIVGRLYGGRISGYLEFCQLMRTNVIPFRHTISA
jgi:hypothetical protein